MRKKFLLNEVGAVAAFAISSEISEKDVGIDDLLEVVLGRIDVAQQLALMQQSPCETIR